MANKNEVLSESPDCKYTPISGLSDCFKCFTHNLQPLLVCYHNSMIQIMRFVTKGLRRHHTKISLHRSNFKVITKITLSVFQLVIIWLNDAWRTT